MQTRIAYDSELDDTEWREVNFPEDVLASAYAGQRHKQPSADELIKAAEKYGPDGILETAIMLGQFQYKKVDDALKKMAGTRGRN